MKVIYKLFTIAAVLLFFAACKKENYAELNKGNMPLAIAASKDSVTLKEKEANNDALILSWTTGTNSGTNSGITYSLELAKQGTDFGDVIIENLGKGVYDRKFTNVALNDSIRSHFNAAAGEVFLLEARVIANSLADGSSELISEPVVIRVTPYDKVSSTLYMVGDAAPNGWDNNNAAALTPITSEPGGFSYTGPLNAGELKFLTTLGQWIPSYNKGSDTASLFYRTDFGQPDDKFIIANRGNFILKINIIDLTISIEETAHPLTPPYSRLWIVGDASPNGWNIDAPNEMRVDNGNLFEFSYNEILKVGEFKIPTTTGNWGTDFYMPVTDHQDLSSNDVELVKGGSPDKKWQITTAGAYKIKLDLYNTKIDIKPFTPYTQLWLLGDATPTGWNINSPTPMVADPNNPYIFTWQGAMTAGEFKIPVATGNFGCDYFMPMVNHQNLNIKLCKFIQAGNPDYKWQITEPGNYKITLNQLKETIDITKQ
jgi:starch-binding outer membrane protein SusE/F